MPIFHFDIYDGLDLPDTVGADLPDLGAAKVEATRIASDLISNNLLVMAYDQNWRLEVTDPEGLVYLTMRFVVTTAPTAQRGILAIDVHG